MGSEGVNSSQCPMPNAHHKLQLDNYGKDFMNRCDVSVYIVPFDCLILTLWFFIKNLGIKPRHKGRL